MTTRITAHGADDLLRARFDDAARPVPAAHEVDWYVVRLPQDAGLALDAMCGSGRLLVPLGERGRQVVTLIQRSDGGELRSTPLGDARFVPLVGEHGFDA